METNNKLISMVAFLDNIEKEYQNRCPITIQETRLFYPKIFNYKNFLKQELNIGMFVPSLFNGKEWEVLTEPDMGNEEDFEQWSKTKENVVFEGFKAKDGLSICDEHSIIHIFWNFEGKWRLSKGLFNIENLVIYGLTLTPNTLKQLGINT